MMTYQFRPQKESFAFNWEFNYGELSPINDFTRPGEMAVTRAMLAGDMVELQSLNTRAGQVRLSQ